MDALRYLSGLQLPMALVAQLVFARRVVYEPK